MADLPKTIRVGYRDYTVEWWPANLASAHAKNGECDSENAILRVADNLDGVKASNTLLHELLHACWYVGGLDDRMSEEGAVTILANQLTQVWRDNPDLVKWLDERLGPQR